MARKRQTSEPDVTETSEAFDLFSEDIGGMMQAILDLKWEEVGFYRGRIESRVRSIEGPEKTTVEAIYEPIQGFAVAFERSATAKTPEDQENALVDSIAARDALRKLRADYRDLTENPGFNQFAL